MKKKILDLIRHYCSTRICVTVEKCSIDLKLSQGEVQHAFHKLNLEGKLTRAYKTSMPCCHSAICDADRYYTPGHEESWPWRPIQPRK